MDEIDYLDLQAARENIKQLRDRFSDDPAKYAKLDDLIRLMSDHNLHVVLDVLATRVNDPASRSAIDRMLREIRQRLEAALLP